MTSKLESWRTEAHEGWFLSTSAEAPATPPTAHPFWESVGGGGGGSQFSFRFPRRKNKYKEKRQKCVLIPGIILIAGWFSWTSLPSCSSCLWCVGTVGTIQKVSSSGGSTQANVLRSAWVESTVFSWLLRGATRAASSNSSVVSSVLRKE